MATACVVLAACAPGAQRRPAATVGAPDTPVSVPRGAPGYEIDSQRTVVTVIVRRAGPLARLGHDHVITSADETGTAWIGDRPETSGFELHLPVEKFAVDLPGARAAAGPEFAAAVPESARAGTRQNLLRQEVLDAARYPAIILRSTAVSGSWPDPRARIAVTLKGVADVLEVRFRVVASARQD